MTAETEGRITVISIYKDIEGLDILGLNDGSYIVHSESDFNAAVSALESRCPVWVHEIEHRNAENRVCFRVLNSTAWEAEEGRLVNKIAWPCPDTQDVCRPCQGGA